MINEIDATILNILQKNARTSNAEIARKVGLAPSAVFERIRKLEERGVIRGYHAAVDRKSSRSITSQARTVFSSRSARRTRKGSGVSCENSSDQSRRSLPLEQPWFSKS